MIVFNKKGVVLLATYSLLLALLIMAGAIFGRAYSASNTVVIAKDNTRALYNSEDGIACAYIEAKAADWNWITHIDENTPVETLAFTTPTAFGGIVNLTDHLYEVPGHNFKVKAFKNGNDLIIRSKSTVGGHTKALELKLTKRSLTDYFFFVSGSSYYGYGEGRKLTFSPNISPIYDFKGSIAHSNGDIEFCDNAILLNVEELTCKGAVYYAVNPYIPSGATEKIPYVYWQDPYFNNDANYIDDRDIYVGGEGYWHGVISPATININNTVSNITIPATLSTSYLWNKWLYPSYPDVDFPGYYSTWPFNPPEPAELSMQNLNSARQAADWANFVNINNSAVLKGRVKDRNLGGHLVTPPHDLGAKFTDLAKNGGLYISTAAGGTPLSALTLSNGTSIAKAVYYRNTIYTPKNGTAPNRYDYKASGQPNCAKAIDIDVGMLGQWLTERGIGFNGVLVIDNNTNIGNLTFSGAEPAGQVLIPSPTGIRFSNATVLPDPGLTIYARNTDIELKGNYNNITSEWKPSMIITEKLVYTLSDNFNEILTPKDPARVWVSGDPYNPMNSSISNYTNISGSEWNTTRILPDTRIPAEIHNKNYPYSKDAPTWQDYYTDSTNGAVNMPNKANDTEYDVAVVTYFDPTGYELERWAYPADDGSDAGTSSTWTYHNKTMKGSFIRMWNMDTNIDVFPSMRSRTKPGYPVVIQHSKMNISYDDRLMTQKPPGDFSGGYPVWWKQLNPEDF